MVLKAKSQETGKKQELIRLSLQACLIAKDAVRNLADALSNGSSMAILAVNDCEKELDEIDQYIDEHIANAILHASALEVRELLACLKFTIDLERIGDLIHDIVVRLRARTELVPPPDLKDLVQMTVVLEQMLDGTYACQPSPYACRCSFPRRRTTPGAHRSHPCPETHSVTAAGAVGTPTPKAGLGYM